MYPSSDIGLIVPLSEEFSYAREILAFEHPRVEGGHYFYPFAVPGSSVRGIATILHDMGSAAAAAGATRLLHQYDVRVLAVVGLSGALSSALLLGDVVVASSVEEYMYAARAVPGDGDQAFAFERGGTSWQLRPSIADFALNFRYLDEPDNAFRGWQERAVQRRDRVLASGVPRFTRPGPEYSVGQIATGDIVSAANAFARWASRNDRKRLAIEMEAGGAARAIYGEHRDNLMVIRGVSDFSDERKGEFDSAAVASSQPGAWRRFAGLNAVDLFATLVAHPWFPWPDHAGGGPAGTQPDAAVASVSMLAWASDDARTYQSAGDMHIGEGYGEGPASQRPQR